MHASEKINAQVLTHAAHAEKDRVQNSRIVFPQRSDCVSRLPVFFELNPSRTGIVIGLPKPGGFQ